MSIVLWIADGIMGGWCSRIIYTNRQTVATHIACRHWSAFFAHGGFPGKRVACAENGHAPLIFCLRSRSMGL